MNEPEAGAAQRRFATTVQEAPPFHAEGVGGAGGEPEMDLALALRACSG